MCRAPENIPIALGGNTSWPTTIGVHAKFFKNGMDSYFLGIACVEFTNTPVHQKGKSIA